MAQGSGRGRTARHQKSTHAQSGSAHSDDVFAEIAYGAQEGFLLVPGAGDKVLLHGRCPRCRGEMDFPIGKGVPYGSGLKSFLDRGEEVSVDAPTANLVTIYCACGYPHKERPGDSQESGCGAYWEVEFDA